MTSSRPIYDTSAQPLWTRVCRCVFRSPTGERVTRARNLARLLTGLVLGQGEGHQLEPDCTGWALPIGPGTQRGASVATVLG